MTVFLAVLCLLIAAAAGSLLAREALIEKLANYDGGAKLATRPGEHYADLADIPEPTWAGERRTTLAATVLPLPVKADLRVVPPVADDSWLEDLATSRPDPFTIPVQRRPGRLS